MRRSVSCRLEAIVRADSNVLLSVAVARGATITESLSLTLDGAEVAVDEITAEHGTRIHRAPGLGSGSLTVVYDAVVVGRAPPPPVDDLDLVRYQRPSRYCESDRIAGFARSEFRGLHGRALLDAVSSWVGMRVAYVADSSRPIDSAVSTLLAREGVCRDFAHLVIALLRACDTPARMVSVYAPGLQPMDFHAVVEAYVEGEWLVVDATCLAPRGALVRIATGRDAADTAFLTSSGDSLTLVDVTVNAVTDSALPDDDLTRPTRLG
jgi:transglutaminase-like putative cysteine protease